MSVAASASPLTPANTSLALQPLKELPLPAPVSWAPQTPGWLAVALAMLAIAMWIGWIAWRRHQRERYRKIALAELDAIAARLNDASRRDAALAAIAPLIKRTALAAAPRERVASLTGDAWLAFLARTRGQFDTRSGALLSFLSYAPPSELGAVSQHDAEALVGHARDWIRNHHVEI
ncbi:DUF4381 domain-containing protein [Paraburkholderia saeva]|uniref:DUF4381 domain-containing protein n=1 Tax=Paraburkholderia saeva TaxID=2777537 RepID=A0A9N8X4P5_9BURK|nr:DUF4381 domain-containing protein [Paraburkholderia saeva]CAG4888981.1 hypothetical protein R70241_00621 [Paraburkholderia saeva]CAG4914172.1 hypothetical protein LMG31841_04345 [Paraburkholderia saeva]